MKCLNINKLYEDSYMEIQEQDQSALSSIKEERESKEEHFHSK